MARAAARSPTEGLEAEPAFGLRDPRLIVLLAGVLALQLLAWSVLDGYQIADSVEYMERARALARGESMIDADAIRPIGFSALLLPFFALSDWLGLPDPRPVVWCTYLVQIALGLCLVQRVARLGVRLAGPDAGLIAGLVIGANPIFLQYSAQAESGLLVGLLLALGIERLLEKGASARDTWIGAAWLGATFLVAYKSLALILAIALVLFVRDRWRARRSWCALLATVTLAMLLQASVDWAMYGSFGASVRKYLIENFGSVLYSFLSLIHLKPLALQVYKAAETLKGTSYEIPANVDEIGYHGRQSRWWYFVNLPDMFVWPVLAGVLLGALRALVRMSWRSTLLLLPCLVYALATSNKGSKDYRIWLPMLAFLAPLCAWGLSGCLSCVRSVAWRSAWLLVVLVPAVVLGTAKFLALDTRHFRGYWRAIEAANDIARAAPGRLRLGSAYHWAIYMREAPEIELVKLPRQLNLWDGCSELEKSADFATLEELDLFLVHHPVLAAHPDLMQWVSEHFEVVQQFYEREVHQDLGPLYLLARRSGRARAATFFERTSGVDPEEFRAAHALGPPAEFLLRPAHGQPERLVFLGCEVRTLPPDEFGWITYHWYTPTGLTRDLTVVDRLTSLDERNTWQNNHRAAWGAYPTQEWRPGEIVSEGYPLVPATQSFDWHTPWRPLGGGYRRGERIPVRLWMEVVELDPEAQARGERVVLARYEPVRPGTDEPLPPTDALGTDELPEAHPISPDGLLRVGAFFLPVHPLARLPDDGRPVPE